MAEKRSRHLQVVRPARTAAESVPEVSRADYWAQVQLLQDERRRLRAG